MAISKFGKILVGLLVAVAVFCSSLIVASRDNESSASVGLSVKYVLST